MILKLVLGLLLKIPVWWGPAGGPFSWGHGFERRIMPFGFVFLQDHAHFIVW
jgi:hypothetical protein